MSPFFHNIIVNAPNGKGKVGGRGSIIRTPSIKFSKNSFTKLKLNRKRLIFRNFLQHHEPQFLKIVSHTLTPGF